MAHPFEKTVAPGLYRLFFEDGKQVEASIGVDELGRNWVAPYAWPSPVKLTGNVENSKLNTIVKIERLVELTPNGLGREFANATTKTKGDQINPKHYKLYPIDSIDIMLKIFGPEIVYHWCVLTAFKYRMRLGYKDEVRQELLKEKWYLDKAEELKKAYDLEI